ncbi:MAG TPA: DUF5313 family protein [Jatrophihabitans sp.]|nr:DUF5313 family protein [Jatrophihabitans sp.]
MSVGTRAWEDAVRSLGIEPGRRRRPNPLLWLWYAFWGPLPQNYRTWVLYDATAPTWILRYVVRVLVAAVLPVAAIAIWLPAPAGVRALTAFVTGACALLFTATWVNEGTEHRIAQAGWPWGLGPELRERRAVIAQRLGSANRRERTAARRSR